MILTSVPADFASPNEDLVWVAYDAKAANPAFENYKYVGEVWINSTLVHTSRVFPRPGGNVGVFNLGSIIREYLNVYFLPESGIKAQQLGLGEFCVNVVFKLREEYNGTIGAVVLTDITRTFLNYYNATYSDVSASGSFTYVLDFVLGYFNLPSTLRPTTLKSFKGNSRLFIPFLSTTTANITVTINGNVKTITPTQPYTLQIINISPEAILFDFPLITLGESYTVQIASGSNSKTYKVDLVCSMYTQYPVHFLNRFGGFETMIFNKVSKKKRSIEKKTFQQPSYRINNSGVISYSKNQVIHEQKTSFGSLVTEKMTLRTDFLSDEEFVWLADLVASPLVYLEKNNTLYPVQITDNDYEENQHASDGLTLLTINVEFGQVLKTQFR